MTVTEATGLTAQQAWTHDHIARCYVCGSWTIATQRVLDLIAIDAYDPPVTCHHLTPNDGLEAAA